MSNDTRLVAHDHFVYLLDKEHFENLPSWLTSNFHVIEGGTHAGGSSRNKLIIFKDGTYLELFSWISEPKEFLAWADKPPGLIDFALTSLPPSTAQQNYVAISQGLQSRGDGDLGVSYDHPRAGGRKRQDGLDVKWETTRPINITASNTPDASFFPTQRLDVPFFCHDITDRTVRVPFDNEELTNHPCGAIGISDVEIVVPQSHFEYYKGLYEVVLGSLGRVPTQNPQANRASFDVPAPKRQGYSSTVSIVAVQEQIEDETHQSYRDRLQQRGIGICNLVLATHNTDKAVKRGLDAEPNAASSIFLVDADVST